MSMLLKLFKVDEIGTDKLLRLRKQYSKRNGKISRFLIRRRWKRHMLRYGANIPLTTKIGKQVCFPHGIVGVFISIGAQIGDNCVIFHQVTIGSNTVANSQNRGAPKIGNNVFIGAGAKIIGNVTIGDNARIGANCVVTKDVPANATVVIQAPRLILHDTNRQNEYIAMEQFLQEEGNAQSKEGS